MIAIEPMLTGSPVAAVKTDRATDEQTAIAETRLTLAQETALSEFSLSAEQATELTPTFSNSLNIPAPEAPSTSDEKAAETPISSEISALQKILEAVQTQPEPLALPDISPPASDSVPAPSLQKTVQDTIYQDLYTSPGAVPAIPAPGTTLTSSSEETETSTSRETAPASQEEKTPSENAASLWGKLAAASTPDTGKHGAARQVGMLSALLAESRRIAGDIIYEFSDQEMPLEVWSVLHQIRLVESSIRSSIGLAEEQAKLHAVPPERLTKKQLGKMNRPPVFQSALRSENPYLNFNSVGGQGHTASAGNASTAAPQAGKAMSMQA